MFERRSTLEAELRKLEESVAREVRVGAAARKDRRQRIWIALAGLALISSAAILYWQLRPDRDRLARRYPVELRCLACGAEQSRDVSYAQSFPVTCTACGEFAARPLWRCRACDARFQPERLTTEIECPQCGSRRVGASIDPASGP